MASLNILSKKKFLVILYSTDHESKESAIFAYYQLLSLICSGNISEGMTMIIINKINHHPINYHYNNHNR